ncbi:DNA-directed RNA polymerase core subunit rpc10 [Arachnomyces sp. PD_36]|nr:DNA-directed RNA polymerase core subunit rpc10 [Arachnomyces sp. PD_36]
MSREAYQVPAVGGPGQQGVFAGAAGLDATGSEGPLVTYVCGDCDARISLKRGDQIRCKDCGHRVLYKERTKSLKRGDRLLGTSGFTNTLMWEYAEVTGQPLCTAIRWHLHGAMESKIYHMTGARS